EDAREARDRGLKAEQERRVQTEEILRAERAARALEMRRSQVEVLLRDVPRDAERVPASQVDTVIGLYNRVLSLDADHVPTLVDRAVLYQRLGRQDDARRDLDRALRISPDDVPANMQRARLAERNGEYALALKHAERAVERRPYEAELHVLRLRVLARLRRFDEAQRLIDQLLPSLPELVRLRVWFYEAERELAGDPGPGLVLLRLGNDTPEGRGLAALADLRHTPALAQFEAACEAHPGGIAAWYGRACAVARSNPRMAQIYLERAWENGLRDCPWHVLWYEPEFVPLHELPDFRALADTGAQSRPRDGD
ncbi:MAG: tetratricopeptide repeat protein, partial [Planctomycetota bacterium]